MDTHLPRLLDRIAAEGWTSELTPLVHLAVQAEAHALVGQSLPGQNPHALVLLQDACRLRQGQDPIADRHHQQLLAMVCHALRVAMVERAHRQAATRSRLPEPAALDVTTVNGIDSANLVDLDAALIEFEALDPGRSRIVEMVFFGGLSTEETGVALGITERNANRGWAAARAWLHRRLRKHR